MVRFVIFFAALLASFTAHAQQLPACVDRAPLPVPAAITPQGLPKQIGGLADLIIESNAKGYAVAWWHQRVGQPSVLYLYAVERSAVTLPMLVDAASLGLPGDNAERIREMAAKYVTKSALDMCDVWGPARDRINAAMPPPLPVPPVAPKMVTASVLSFNAANGALAGLAGTISRGLTCDCRTPLVIGSTTYCTFAGAARPSVVAWCKAP